VLRISRARYRRLLEHGTVYGRGTLRIVGIEQPKAVHQARIAGKKLRQPIELRQAKRNGRGIDGFERLGLVKGWRHYPMQQRKSWHLGWRYGEAVADHHQRNAATRGECCKRCVVRDHQIGTENAKNIVPCRKNALHGLALREPCP
jgi:hypothetical protein